MTIVLVAVLALVLLTAFDADLWPRLITPSRRRCRTRRSITPHVQHATLRRPTTRRISLPRMTLARRSASNARWWWE
jgi:hypothetical protein